MKTTRSGRRLVPGFIAVLSTLVVALTEDPVSGTSTNRVAPTAVPAPALAAPVIEASLSTPPAVAEESPPTVSFSPTVAAVTLEPVIAPVESPGAITTSISLDTPGAAARQPDEEVQRRLEAPTPEQLIERHGSLGFLIRQPEPRAFLDLINPFAPSDYGPREREVYNRNPNLKPGATLPRTFINDMTHEPTMNLFDWTW